MLRTFVTEIKKKGGKRRQPQHQYPSKGHSHDIDQNLFWYFYCLYGLVIFMLSKYQPKFRCQSKSYNLYMSKIQSLQFLVM